MLRPYAHQSVLPSTPASSERWGSLYLGGGDRFWEAQQHEDYTESLAEPSRDSNTGLSDSKPRHQTIEQYCLQPLLCLAPQANPAQARRSCFFGPSCPDPYASFLLTSRPFSVSVPSPSVHAPPAGADFCFCHFCLLGPNADGTSLGYKALSHLRLARDMQEFSVILHLFFFFCLCTISMFFQLVSLHILFCV